MTFAPTCLSHPRRRRLGLPDDPRPQWQSRSSPMTPPRCRPPGARTHRHPTFVFVFVLLSLTPCLYADPSSGDQRALPPVKAVSIRDIHRYFRTQFVDADDGDPQDSFAFRQQVEGPSFYSGPNDTQVLTALTNCEAEATLTYTFVPKENYTIEDYQLVPSIVDTSIVSGDDVNIVYSEITILGALAYNVTVFLDFNKWTGKSNFSLQALNASTLGEEATSANAELLTVGITFFQTNGTGSKFPLCGPATPLVLSAAELESNPSYNLGVFIQFYDGSTSEEALSVPLSGLEITTSGLGQLVTYEESCPAESGNFDGNDIQFTSTCNLGFSTNLVGGAYVGPQFGFDFNPYRNGTFTVSVEWNELVLGSDLELDGYGTLLNVQVEGEVPPLVSYITPAGPFQVLGTDQAVLHVDNLPATLAEAQLWTSVLSIDFGGEVKPAQYDEGSLSIFQNGTASLSFTLPAGVGTDLPWTFSVTKPTLEVLSGVDQTNPTYFFSFERTVIISGIAPASGTEEGGTNVTITGEFPIFDGETISVFFDGVEIAAELITSTAEGEIVFITPSRESVGSGFQVTVTVAISDAVSNGIEFSYIPSIILDSVEPPAGPVDGGTEVTLTGQFIDFDPSAADTGIFFGNVQISSTLIESSNNSVIVFRTPEHSFFDNSDTVFTYDVSVQLAGALSNSIPFTYQSPLQIYSISPNSGDETGGTTVALNGSFPGFDPSNSALVFGGKELDLSTIFYNDTLISFDTPPKSEIGSAFTWKVWVAVGNLASNFVYFTYEDTNSGVTIDGGGGGSGSGGSTGDYQIGVCTDSVFRAVLSSGVRFQNPEYAWTMTEVGGDGTDVLSNHVPQVAINAAVLFLPYDVFPKQEVQYNLNLRVVTDFTSFEQSVTLVQSKLNAIAVRIYDPRVRSISDPNVTLTIPADFGIPGCQDGDLIMNSTSITYKWIFRETEYVFSYLNTTAPEEEVSPTLLGREFHIPQALMAYGTFSLSLRAYFTEEESVEGSDSTTVIIEPAPLVAQINAGEASQFISVDQDLSISAGQSFDPDVLAGDPIIGLSFAWSCRYAWEASMTGATPCGDDLLSSSNVDATEFTVSSDALRSVYNTSSDVYMEYTLQVKKTSKNATDDDLFRESEVVTSIFVLVKESGVVFEALKEVTVANNQSALLDKARVKYYEEVIITPVSETSETSWTFELLTPLAESRTLLATDANLINLAGFVTARSEASRLSLGIRANALTPNTEYSFLISTFQANSEVNYEVNKHVIVLSTVESPTVTVGNLATPVGNTSDTFVLSAYTNYEADFKYFFILTDDFALESCVGGCQGENVVRFTLASPGNYSVRCDVYDSLGNTLLATDTGANITVEETAAKDGDLSSFAEDADSAFLAGDHSDFQQLGIDMVKYIWSNNASLAPGIDSEVIANFTEGMNQIVANAVPNAIQSAAYVRVVAALATLSPDTGIAFSTETLYLMVNITVSAVERTPENGALQQLEELLAFYELTPELVLATYSEGSSRRRLLQDGDSAESEILTLWIDLYEVMKEQVALTVLKRCACGCVEEIVVPLGPATRDSTSNSRRWLAQEARQLSPAAAYLNPLQGQLTPVKIAVGHFCNSEQSTALVLNENTPQQVEFSWCKEIFENTIKKLYFAVATTPNYLYLSNLHQNVTLSQGLAGTMIAEINQNEVINATLPIPGCYSLNVPILRNLTEGSAGAPDDQVPKGILFAPQKELQQNGTAGLYIPTFEGIDTAIQDSSQSADTDYITARLSMSTTGVLAIATRIAWSGAFFSLEGVFLTGAEVAGVVTTLFILLLVACVVVWLLATRLFTAREVVPPVEADFTYVERDVYGRGTAIDMMEEQEALRRGNQASVE